MSEITEAAQAAVSRDDEPETVALPALPGAAPTPGLNKALALVQAEIPRIVKGDTANAGTYKYDYAGLDAVTEKILPLLGKHGLSFSCWPTLEGPHFVLRYYLLHESGESMTGAMRLPERVRNSQELGSVITYYRRYTLMAVTGAAPSGEDDDAQSVRDEAQDLGPRRLQQARPRPPAAAAAAAFREKLAVISRHFERLDVPRDRQLEAARVLADRDHITSANDLTAEEADTVIAVLEGVSEPGDLQELLTGRAGS